MYSFKQIKEHLKAQPAIKFDVPSIAEKNVRDFLKVFFSYYNRKFTTVYVESGLVQTKSGKRRSISDIYNLCRFYFPNVRLTTVYKTLLTYIKENKFFSYICHATGLRVYRDNTQDVYGGGGFFNGPLTDEYYVDFNQFEELNGIPLNEIGGNDDEDDKHIQYKTI